MHCASSTDLSLFDELENLGDAEDLLEALENGVSVSNYSVIMQMTDLRRCNDMSHDHRKN